MIAREVNFTSFFYTEALYNFLKGPAFNDDSDLFEPVDKNSSIYIKRSLPFQTSVLSNFGQYDNSMFWQMTTSSSLEIIYDRRSTKQLYNQWNKIVGPVSTSGVDRFQIQYDCLKGNSPLNKKVLTKITQDGNQCPLGYFGSVPDCQDIVEFQNLINDILFLTFMKIVVKLTLQTSA